MKKHFQVVPVVLLAVFLAAPAMAGTDLTGFYRSKAWMSNFRTSGSAPVVQEAAPANAFVEQRMRMKITTGEENVKFVAQFEIDFSAWGDQAGSAAGGTDGMRNNGGALGGDKINLETKNVYVWFKLPDTSLDFTVGLQNQSDSYAGLIYGGADMAGIFMNGKAEPVSYTLGWAKLYENSSSKSDDLTLYLASAKLTPSKDVKLGLNFYFVQDDTQKPAVAGLPTSSGLGNGALWGLIPAGQNKKRIYTPGVDFTANAGPATLTGFFIYQFGKIDYLSAATPDISIGGYAIDLRGDMNVGAGKGFLEGIYLSGGDNPSSKVKSITTFSDFDASPGGNSAYGRTDMSVLLVNLDDINCAQALVGARASAVSTSPSLGGRGMTHFAAGYTQKLNDKLTGKAGIGYLRANNLLTSSLYSQDSTRKGKTLGTEINGNLNYNIMKGLDFGMYLAYAFLGDYFEYTTQGATPATRDADNVYSANFRLNYAF